jgi:hypothetical protein
MLAVASAAAASAASVHITEFVRGDLAFAQAAHAAFMGGQDRTVFGSGGHFGANTHVKAHRIETFSGFDAWNGTTGTTNPVTSVGAFTSLGGTGTGHSAINGGTGLEVRNADPFRWGRHSALNPGQGHWLDSNDTYGMRWEVGGIGSFNALGFFLTDVADVGATFSLTVNGTLYTNSMIGTEGRRANGTIHWVRILLDETVNSLVVEMRHDRLNDGFGIDGVTVAHIAPIPLPPALAFMLAGLAGLLVLRRRANALPAGSMHVACGEGHGRYGGMH